MLNGFMKRSYLDITDFLQTVAVFVKLHKKSHQHCPLIHRLCCYHHSRRKIRRIPRICTFSRISWICKNRKNFAKYFMLVCYALFVLSTARINVKNNLISTYPPWKLCKRYFPLPGTFSNFSQFFSFPFFTWHVLQFCNIKEFVICTC